MATFDRGPDANGFGFWMDQLDTSGSILDVARSMFVAPEGQDLYGGLDTGSLVDKVYNNLLDRDPGQEGRDYWIDALDKGHVSRGFFVEAVINGAEANDTEQGQEDTELIAEKTEVAEYFVNRGLNDTDKAHSILEQVEAGESVEAVKAGLDSSTSQPSSSQGDVSTDNGSSSMGGDTISTALPSLPPSQGGSGPAEVRNGTDAGDNIDADQSGAVLSGNAGEDRFLFSDAATSQEVTIDDFEDGDQLFFGGGFQEGGVGIQNVNLDDDAMTVSVAGTTVNLENLPEADNVPIVSPSSFESAFLDALAFA